jgi:hypothetical protein
MTRADPFDGPDRDAKSGRLRRPSVAAAERRRKAALSAPMGVVALFARLGEAPLHPPAHPPVAPPAQSA